MKIIAVYALVLFCLMACRNNPKLPEEKHSTISLNGTWKLFSATIIENNDTTVTNYTGDTSFIKIINNTHFAFLQHDLNRGKDSGAVFAAGGGTYSLKDSLYTEHLDYCSDRQWEGNDFSFIVTISNDTLIQRGIEKVDAAGINRLNMEKYIRVGR